MNVTLHEVGMEKRKRSFSHHQSFCLRALLVLLIALVVVPLARTEQTGQILAFPNQRLNLKTKIKLGQGWENFRVMYPSGAAFVIPTRLMVEKNSGESYAGTGGISFFVEGNGTVAHVDTYYDEGTSYQDVAPIGDTFVFGANVFAGFYQINVSGELMGPNGEAGRAQADGESAQVVQVSGISPSRNYQGGWTITVDFDDCGPCSSGDCEPGATQAEVGSIDLTIGLGRSVRGGSLATIKAQRPNKGLARPNLLNLNLTSDAELVSFANCPRQVRLPSGLVDIVAQDPYAYELRFYSPDNVGIKDASGLYQTTGSHFRKVRIANPEASPTVFNRLHVTEFTCTGNRTTEYSYAAATNTWSLVRPDGLGSQTVSVNETLAANGSPVSRTSIVSINDGNGTLVAKTQTKTQRFAWGWEVTEEKLDPDGAGLTSTFEYFTDPLAVGSYGRLRQTTNAYGHWVKYAYDGAGFEIKRVTQYLDNSISSPDESNRVVTTSFAPTIPHKTVVETVNGNEVGRSYTTFGVEGNDNAISVETEARCVVPGAAWNAPENLVTTTKRYNPISSGLFAGELVSVRYPDGTLRVSSYSQTASQRMITTDQGASDATGSAVMSGRRVDLTTDLQGNQISRRVSDLATGIVVESATTHTTDTHGRPTLVAYSDGTSEATAFMCCAVASRTDRNGVATAFSYDALRRLETETRDGLTVSLTYDGAGRIKSKMRTGTDNSTMTIENNAYDLAGRLTTTKDGVNNQTSFQESFDANGRTVRTTTLPTTHSYAETFHKDGTLLARTGAASRPVRYEHGFATGGLRFTKEILVGEQASETEWIKTYFDMADRIVRVEYADGAQESRHYNLKGQIEWRTDPDNVKSFVLFNGEGEIEEQILDADGSGTISNGDRRTKTTREVVSGPLFKTTTREGEDLVVSSVVEESPNGRYRREVRDGIETTSSRTYDGAGGATQTTTHPDNSTTIRVFENERIVSSVRQGTGGEISESVSSQYDSHRRLWKQFDARASTVTEFGYNSADQRTSTKRGTELTSYGLDGLGQVTSEILPGTNRTISRSFYPTGQLHTENGTAAYPVSYTYDPQGRRRTMSTATGTTTWAYHPQRGWLASKADDSNKKIEYLYTPAGRLETRVWARGVTTTFGYNDAGDLETTTYSDGTPSVTRQYDDFGRLRAVDDVAGKRELSYAGRFDIGTDALTGTPLWSGLSVTRGYDSLRRSKSITAKRNGTTLVQATFDYDGVSRLRTASSANYTATFAYHPSSTLVQSVIFQSGSNTTLTQYREFDSLARPTMVSTSPANGVVSSVSGPYDSQGFRERATMAGGNYWDYGYNDRGEVTSGIKRNTSGQAIHGYQFGYSFDGIGNRLASSVNGNSATYTPDNLNRYQARTVPAVVTLLGKAASNATVTVNSQPSVRDGEDYFAQLAVSNGVAPVFLNATTVATSPSGMASLAGRIFVPKSPEVFTYDEDGNLRGDGRWTYSWDGENRLVAMETAPAAAQAGSRHERLLFQYDYLGRRITKTSERWNGAGFRPHYTLQFVYDGWNLVAEMLAGGPLVRTYTWGTDLSGTWQGAGGIGGLLFINQKPESKTFAPGYDLNGNVAALYDLAQDGMQVARYEYGPFGEPLVATGSFAAVNPIRWSTKYHDTESGLAYFGYRYYSPVTGRFINRDPIEEEGGVNLYGFCYNNSISMIDTLGDSPKSVINTWQDAKEHWQSGAGGSVSAGSTLMATIKNSSGYKTAKADAEKAREADLKKVPCSDSSGKIHITGKTIGFDAGNLAVGNIDVEIQDYDFIWTAGSKGSDCKRKVEGSGNRSLSFNDEYNFTWDPNRPVKTFFTDTVPSINAGKGSPFWITGSWVDTIKVSVMQDCSSK